MITCYLDSQDYSTLSDPKTLATDPDRVVLRETLTRFAREGKVQFVFSAAAVCEGVALSPDASHLAELKAELLSDLCGGNALVSFDRLLHAETVALAERRPPPSHMIDPDGNWFPTVPVLDPTDNQWQRLSQIAEDDLSTTGLSRQQRRAAVRKMVKNGKPTNAFKKHLDQQNSSPLLALFIKQYPMKAEYAEVMTRYGLGRASEVEFTRALFASMRDPRWMMKWFTQNHALSNPIADIVRKPGRELGEMLRQIVTVSARWASAMQESGADSDPTGKHGEIFHRWIEMQDTHLLNLVGRHADAQEIALGAISSVDIEKYCPGISTAIRSLFSSAWENVGGSRKEEPSDSQPVDALHAMYAPYVRVFRADRFMAPHIQRQVKRHGTIVVSRLSQLVNVLETEILRER